MSFRSYKGNTISENGWRICDRNECDIPRIRDLFLVDTAPLRKGPPLTILGAWLKWYDTNVEEIGTPVWGWSLENAVANSNHLSGTAADINAPKYPWGQRVMPPDRIAKIRRGLDLFEGSVFWGADWNYADEMHVQLSWREDDRRNEAFAEKLRNGYLGIYATSNESPTLPTFDVGLTAETLAVVMGNSLSLDRYRELLPLYVEAMHRADITTVNRAAMFGAQLGHECLGLKYMQEIADGSAYEGRGDLGNTQPGDGRRFKGRGPIQITGRHNYTQLSKWAANQGYVPTPTFFVDSPEQLATDRYAFLGPVWYWTVARPDLNTLSDNKDLVAATRRINGGTNGLEDRRQRYTRALSLGDALLAGDDMAFLDETFTNWQGNTVSVRDYLHYTDKYIGLSLDQLMGPDSRAQGGEPTRWPILENRTLVEGVAESLVQQAEILSLLRKLAK